jgi:hypothetical protein
MNPSKHSNIPLIDTISHNLTPFYHNSKKILIKNVNARNKPIDITSKRRGKKTRLKGGRAEIHRKKAQKSREQCEALWRLGIKMKI